MIGIHVKFEADTRSITIKKKETNGNDLVNRKSGPNTRVILLEFGGNFKINMGSITITSVTLMIIAFNFQFTAPILAHKLMMLCQGMHNLIS